MKDTFRKEYKPVSPHAQELIKSIKETAEAMESLMRQVQNREMSIAMTNLEQCTMWATKAIVLRDEQL